MDLCFIGHGAEAVSGKSCNYKAHNIETYTIIIYKLRLERCTCEEDSYSLLENSDTESDGSQTAGNLQSFYQVIDLPTENDSGKLCVEDDMNEIRFQMHPTTV